MSDTLARRRGPGTVPLNCLVRLRVPAAPGMKAGRTGAGVHHGGATGQAAFHMMGASVHTRLARSARARRDPGYVPNDSKRSHE